MGRDPAGLDDGALAALCAGGHQAAFAEIVRRHQRALFRLARAWTGDGEEAADLVQEAFVAGWAAIGRFAAGRPLRPWLAAILLNKCRDWARRRAVRRLVGWRPLGPADAELVADDGVAADDQAADRQALARVARAVAALPVALKEPLLLRTIEGLSQAETAHLLRISEKAVETRVRRARARLAARLETREG